MQRHVTGWIKSREDTETFLNYFLDCFNNNPLDISDIKNHLLSEPKCAETINIYAKQSKDLNKYNTYLEVSRLPGVGNFFTVSGTPKDYQKGWLLPPRTYGLDFYLFVEDSMYDSKIKNCISLGVKKI